MAPQRVHSFSSDCAASASARQRFCSSASRACLWASSRAKASRCAALFSWLLIVSYACARVCRYARNRLYSCRLREDIYAGMFPYYENMHGFVKQIPCADFI